MIVKMKKLTLLLGLKDRDSTLKTLRKLGVLHIQDIKTPVSEDIQSLETKLENVNKALQIISEHDNKQADADVERAPDYVEQILSLTQQKDVLNRELSEHKEIYRWYQKWGDISYASLQKLKQAGVFVRLYITDKNAVKTIADDKTIHIEKEEHGAVYLALFAESSEERLDLKEDHVPQVELVDVKSKISQAENEINNINNSVKDLSQFRNSLLDYQKDLEKRLQLNRVKYGMGHEGQLVYLQGFCPEDSVPQIKKTAEKDGWGYLVQDPDEPNEVPTLMRNPKWLRIIEPLFDFMGTLPGYHELDVSFVFLAFFSVFFAMLVGDGGYGLVFLICTFLLSRKFKDGPREFINLMYVLSVMTVVWGLITGNWFGLETFAKLPLLSMFIVPQLDTFREISTDVVMQLSFIIGVIQLSIGHLLSAVKKMNSITALAEIGWVVVLWGVFFVANNLVLGKPLPDITIPLLITGIVIIAVFANFQKNILKGILLSLGNLPLDIISSFSDIVSYIRLFAVGFASFIVAASFNSMAIGSGIDSVVSGIIAAIILFLGHALNIALCGMAVLVHGVRLNMLEFSGHVGVQWTGKPYKPFKE